MNRTTCTITISHRTGTDTIAFPASAEEFMTWVDATRAYAESKRRRHALSKQGRREIAEYNPAPSNAP